MVIPLLVNQDLAPMLLCIRTLQMAIKSNRTKKCLDNSEHHSIKTNDKQELHSETRKLAIQISGNMGT